MPSVSGDQQRLMSAALRRKRAGVPRSTDPKMSPGKLQDLSRKKAGAPERAKGYGKPPVNEYT